VTKADLSKDPKQVSAMFDSVAHSYDRTNDLLSFGQARLWRSRVKNAVKPANGERILDLAAGTGTSSMALRVPGAVVVAADFSRGMIEEGKKRYPELQFEFADAMALPFEDRSFDAVTISFGLRNVQGAKARRKISDLRVFSRERSAWDFLSLLSKQRFAQTLGARLKNPRGIQLPIRIH
jgi:demethylmenaquinone methyltransferase/2-methoxy-6-polyprenyl-1,4-benzoquinol methylase